MIQECFDNCSHASIFSTTLYLKHAKNILENLPALLFFQIDVSKQFKRTQNHKQNLKKRKTRTRVLKKNIPNIFIGLMRTLVTSTNRYQCRNLAYLPDKIHVKLNCNQRTGLITYNK